MKTKGDGFKYFLDGTQIETFDKFEKKTKDLDIREIKVEGLNLYARTEQK